MIRILIFNFDFHLFKKNIHKILSKKPVKIFNYILEMERVFASTSEFAKNPQKFYIRIHGCCRWNLRIDKSIHTLSAINILIRIRTMQRQMRGLLSIYSNFSLYDTKRKQLSPEKAEKLLFLKKNIYP